MYEVVEKELNSLYQKLNPNGMLARTCFRWYEGEDREQLLIGAEPFESGETLLADYSRNPSIHPEAQAILDKHNMDHEWYDPGTCALYSK